MHSVERYLLNAIFRIIKPTPRNSETPARLNLTLNYPVFANYLREDPSFWYLLSSAKGD